MSQMNQRMGLLDLFGGQQQGLLGDPLMGMAQGLLAASGPSATPISFGQALGQGFKQMNENQESQMDRQLKYMLLQAQMKKLDNEDKITPYQQRYLDILEKKADPSRKPLPASALKLQQESLDNLGISNNISADLKQITQKLDSGELDIGPVENLLSKGKNFLGLSDDNSRNYATFRATLEKMRNDSLRLNKGVQTEGDAVRAWDEILADLNDGKLVSNRLKEAAKINERGALLQQNNIDVIRSNYGQDPLDLSTYQQPAAIMNAPSSNKSLSDLSDEELLQMLGQ